MRKISSYSSARLLHKISILLILILVVIQVAISCAPKKTGSQPDTAQSLSTPSAYPIVDPSQNSTSFEFNQSAAMLPASQNDLAALSNAPRYNIDLRINFEERSFEGRSQVDYTNTEDVDLNIEQILSQIKTKVFIEFFVNIPMHFDLDKLAQEQTVRGTLVKHSLERVDVLTSAQEREKEQNALMYALQALEGRQIRPL